MIEMCHKKYIFYQENSLIGDKIANFLEYEIDPISKFYIKIYLNIVLSLWLWLTNKVNSIWLIKEMVS